MRKKLEKILAGTILAAGIILFGWMGYDTLKSRIEIEREAINRGVSVYKVCKEKGRSDVVDMIEIEREVKNFGGYIWAGDVIIPIYTINPE